MCADGCGSGAVAVAIADPSMRTQRALEPEGC